MSKPTLIYYCFGEFTNFSENIWIEKLVVVNFWDNFAIWREK